MSNTTDLSSARDMSAGALSCSAALDCYDACDTDACIDDCYARDTAKAKMLDDDLFYGCPARVCHMTTDAGVTACSSAEVAAVMADPNASVSPDCEDCMFAVDVNDSCAAELAACEADK